MNNQDIIKRLKAIKAGVQPRVRCDMIQEEVSQLIQDIGDDEELFPDYNEPFPQHEVVETDSQIESTDVNAQLQQVVEDADGLNGPVRQAVAIEAIKISGQYKLNNHDLHVYKKLVKDLEGVNNKLTSRFDQLINYLQSGSE